MEDWLLLLVQDGPFLVFLALAVLLTAGMIFRSVQSPKFRVLALASAAAGWWLALGSIGALAREPPPPGVQEAPFTWTWASFFGGVLLLSITTVLVFGRKGARRELQGASVRIVMQSVVSLIVLTASLFVIVAGVAGDDAQKWAFASTGVILGYWLK